MDNIVGMIIGTIKYGIALAILITIFDKFNNNFNFVDKMYTDGSFIYNFFLDASENITDILDIKR